MSTEQKPVTPDSSAVGERTVLLYALLTYLPQFCLHLFREDSFGVRYRMSENSQPLAVFIPLLLLSAFALHALYPRIRSRGQAIARLGSLVFQSILNLPFALALVGLALNFGLTQGLSFRQTGPRFSDAGAAVTILMFCKSYVYGWLLYHFLLVIRGARYSFLRARFEALLFLVTLVLSVTSALEVLPIVWAAIFVLLRPARLRALFVSAEHGPSVFMRMLKLALLAPLAVVAVAAVIAIGYINKSNVKAFEDLISDIGIGYILEETMIRASSSYAAVISFASFNLPNGGLYQQVLAVPVENVPYRVAVLFDSGWPRPTITQINRLNYLNYDRDPRLPRAGASPGLVASAFYAGPFPLGFIVVAAYTVLIMRIVNLPFRPISRVRPAAVVLTACFVYPLFESPLDYLLLIDPALLYLAAIMLALVAAASRPALAE